MWCWLKVICYVCILRWKPLNTVCDTQNSFDCVFFLSLLKKDEFASNFKSNFRKYTILRRVVQTVWKIVYLSIIHIHLFTKRLWKVKTLNVVSGRQTNLFNTNATTYKITQENISDQWLYFFVISSCWGFVLKINEMAISNGETSLIELSIIYKFLSRNNKSKWNIIVNGQINGPF